MSGRIVVGIDGSESAAEALRWAVEQARLTGAVVEAIFAWNPGPLVSFATPPLLDWEPLRKAAEAQPGQIVAEVIGSDRPVRILPEMLTGNPAQVLVDRSAEADLLVVGSRGLGGLKGMLLGSVGHHCAAHAHCPVVIVRHTPVPERHKPRRRTLSEARR